MRTTPGDGQTGAAGLQRPAVFASWWHPGGCGACDNANDGLEVSCGSEPFDADYASTLAGVAQYQPGYDRDGDAHDEQTRTGRPDPRNAGCSSSR